MAPATFLRHPVRQIAYCVPDARKAAADHAAAFGSGPYFVMEHIPLTLARYRGQSGVLDHTSAYGQWGEVMVEMVQTYGSEPSVFTDLYPDGGPGFHHIALIVDSLPQAMSAFAAMGFSEAFYGELGPGAAFTMMDATRQFGHFIELYEPSPTLLGVYELVKNAALDFDGGNPVRDFSLF